MSKPEKIEKVTGVGKRVIETEISTTCVKDIACLQVSIIIAEALAEVWKRIHDDEREARLENKKWQILTAEHKKEAPKKAT